MEISILENMVEEKISDANIEGYEVLLKPIDLIRDIPISKENANFIYKSREIIKNILDKKDNRKIVFVGPCSIHDVTDSLEYAKKLKKLSYEVSDKLYIVMRTYFEKPRTVVGWKGLIYDPYLDGSHNISAGLKISRKFLQDLTNLKIPCATEFVGPIVPRYIADFISWGAIGARTTESQVHRELASGLSMPIGFKNSTSGDIGVAVDAANSSRHPHKFIGIDIYGNACRVSTKGNLYSHVVLRGGNGVPNCSPELVKQTLELLDKSGIPRNIIIDCSHGNSDKKYEKQEEVLYSVGNQIKSGSENIIGVMLESNNLEGKQPFPIKDLSKLEKGKSITDGCIGWETTEKAIRNLYKIL